MENKYQQCAACGEVLPLSSDYFYKDKRSKTGYKTQCIECKREYYKMNKEYKISYQKKYIKDNYESFKRYQRWYQNYVKNCVIA